jgi:hypothetical protein
MILINLLPPELRKRAGNISPVAISILAGGIANLLMIGFWIFLSFIRIPHAEKFLAEKKTELTVKTAEALKVKEIEDQILSFKARRDVIVGLLAAKLYWAKTLDDFANLLTGVWTVPGFEMRVEELSIKEVAGKGNERKRGGGGSKAETRIQYGFKWKSKLVGADVKKAAVYINSFCKTTEKSVFWQKNGFVGKPDDRLPGHQPEWNADIARVTDKVPFEWMREKVIAAPTEKVAPAKTPPGKPAAAPAAKAAR